MTDAEYIKVGEPKKHTFPFFPIFSSVFLLLLIAIINLMYVDGGHYRILAESFLSGRLDFQARPVSGWGDTSFFDGRYYWPIGSLPAVLAIPFIWVGIYTQGRFSLIATLIIFYLCAKLAKNFRYSLGDSLWLALAFCFGTSFVGVAILPVGSYLAQVVAVLFLFLALCELEGKRRPFIIGCMVGLAMASRPVSGLNILLFLAIVSIRSGITATQKIMEFAKTIIPFAAVIMIMALYNFARFGDPFEIGYRYQLMYSGVPFVSSSVPTVSLKYIPSNLCAFLFALPDGRGIATSALLISPYLVWLLLKSKWDLTGKFLAGNILIVLATLFAFRNVGFFQMGYRFSLDFLPLVFWEVIRSEVKISKGIKFTIFASILSDVLLAVHFLATSATRVTPPPMN